jgi:hypothetical protein
MIALLMTLALAADLPPPTDLDGDGTPEALQTGEEVVHVGAAEAVCGSDGFPCELEVHDILAGDGKREVAVCSFGPRGDRSCELFRYAAGVLTPLPFPFQEGSWPPSAIRTTGSGIVLVNNDGRLYSKVDKFVLRGDRLERVPQAAHPVDRKVVVDRGFPIHTAPGGGTEVANVRAGSTITVRAEHGEKTGWYLVLISSGLMGWVQQEALVSASDELMAVWGAG